MRDSNLRGLLRNGVLVCAAIGLLALAWNELRVTRNALAKLSDRELADIGLSRYEADHLGR